MHYLLIYDTAPDYLERRAEYRDAHLGLAWQAADRGALILGGAVGDPIDGAVLLFDSADAEVPAAFAKNDPYVLNGLIVRWRVVPWHTVAGAQATQPLRPS